MVNGRTVLNQSLATVGSQFSVKYRDGIVRIFISIQYSCCYFDTAEILFQIPTSVPRQMVAAVTSVLILQEATNVNVQTRN